MTTASADDQIRLLELQGIDTGLDQLEHRLRTLPERVAMAERDAQIVVLRDRLVAAETEVGDLERAVRRAEAEVETVRTRSTKDEELLISGTITSPKQLEELQHEVASLARRCADLEDAELVVMEQLESATAHKAQVEQELATVVLARSEAEAEVAEAERQATGQRFASGERRSALVAGLPTDLLSLYEKVRADHSGVGAARIHRGRCEGCRMELPPSDLARIRTAEPDVVLRCEECRRILVRTPESGL